MIEQYTPPERKLTIAIPTPEEVALRLEHEGKHPEIIAQKMLFDLLEEYQWKLDKLKEAYAVMTSNTIKTRMDEALVDMPNIKVYPYYVKPQDDPENCYIVIKLRKGKQELQLYPPKKRPSSKENNGKQLDIFEQAA